MLPEGMGYNFNISLVLNLYAKCKQSLWNVHVKNSFYGKGTDNTLQQRWWFGKQKVAR